MTSLISAGQSSNNPDRGYIVSTAIRNPFDWYKSLYQYLVRRNFGECACGILARLDWENFVDLVLSPTKTAGFSKKHRKFFRPKDLFENMVLDFEHCSLDVGLYSFILLSRVFVSDVFKYSVDEIVGNSEDLSLVGQAYVFRTEHLSDDFLDLIGDKENRLQLQQIDASPNRSPDLVTVSNEQQKSIYQ